MKKLLMASLYGVGLLFTVSVGHAAGYTDTVQAPTAYFVPSDAQKYDYPYYRGNGDGWAWYQNPIAVSFSSASLNVSAFDVDSCCGEVDNIYAEDSGSWVLLGSLTGLNNQWVYGNSFALGSNFFDDIASGLHVKIDIDVNDDGWFVTLGKSALSVDGGGLPPPTPGVPEPTTWAMMLIGFVGLGAWMRRRRSAIATA